MKRAVAVIGAVAASAVVFLMVTAGTAMAACQQYPPTKDCVEGTTETNNVVKSAGDTAFTGSNVSVWMVLLAVLIVAGVSALFIARRRAAASRS